jgi:hypothetical protein
MDVQNPLNIPSCFNRTMRSQISPASGSIAKQRRDLLIFACLYTAAFSVAASALDASAGVVYVPCEEDNRFGPVIDAGTTLVVQNCDSSSNGTGLTVRLNETSGGLSGLSIVVKNIPVRRVFSSSKRTRCLCWCCCLRTPCEEDNRFGQGIKIPRSLQDVGKGT